MPLLDHGPRLTFLKESASSLHALSPSTAAHMMMLHNQILRDEWKPLSHRQQESCCGGCGSTRTPESNKEIPVQPKITKRAKSTTKGVSTEGATVYQCLRCRRRTILPNRKAAARSTPTSKLTLNPASSSTTAAEEQDKAGKTTDNAGSKKRAKARKQGGLQSLLASKKTQSNSQSLDLFDFLHQ